MKIKFSKINEIIEDAKHGKMFVLVDDESRENEGDIVIPASKVSAKSINFMAKYGRGLICLALNQYQVNKLNLSLMSPSNNSRTQTAFTVSIEAKKGVTTGISAHDSHLTEVAYVNATPKLGYTDIPGKLSDPADWIVVNDDILFDGALDLYGKGAHPGFNMYWRIGSPVRGQNGPGAPRGVNTGTVDGAVQWTPQQETMLGWPGWGGGLNSYLLIRQLEPPRLGRPGLLS